jgi:SAM-dependent methyltransferase
MLEVARARAAELGLDNVEFKRLELEWIDLPTASVDAIICRWGLMLCLDPPAALSEARRVLAPGGRIGLAVWDEPGFNPWATVPAGVLIELGHTAPPDPGEPGMFALASAERLHELLQTAGFLEVMVDSIEVERHNENVDEFVAETLDLSRMFSDVYERLSDEARAEIRERIAAGVQPYLNERGALRLPGRSLVASASA